MFSALKKKAKLMIYHAVVFFDENTCDIFPQLWVIDDQTSWYPCKLTKARSYCNALRRPDKMEFSKCRMEKKYSYKAIDCIGKAASMSQQERAIFVGDWLRQAKQRLRQKERAQM
ncbi:unnamed protein product [Darwinula stevensoni]|uniref:Uncharacterized protein n=1 Tax=Darwinula stevensoni TaxID=69355 RepID=A0A7R9FSV0_9CRUS|nr:unnamed protein product [Darwinula stevensoni]CAG0904305.1 unnamed protein product [Darwinula stevensoni]